MALTVGQPDPFAQTLSNVRGPTTGGALPTPSESSSSTEGPSFGDRLAEIVKSADTSQREAQTAAEGFAAGSNEDIHGTMIALQKADISLRLVANVRNRAIEAYREIMRMGA